MELLPDMLVINANVASRQPDRLGMPEAVFHAFFWKNVLPPDQYRERMTDGILLGELLGKVYGHHASLLDVYEEQYVQYHEQDPLYVHAHQINEWMREAGDEEVGRLIRIAYRNLLDGGNDEAIWSKSMEEASAWSR